MRDWGWRYWAIVLTIAFMLNLGAVLYGARPTVGGLFVWPIIFGRVIWKGRQKDPVTEARKIDHSWTDADERQFKKLTKERLKSGAS
jgi:hypothetical protein